MRVGELLQLPDDEVPRHCLEVVGYLVATGAFSYLAEEPDDLRGILLFPNMKEGLKSVSEQLYDARAEMYFGSTVLYHGSGSARGWLIPDGPPMFPLRLSRAFDLQFQGRLVIPGAFLSEAPPEEGEPNGSPVNGGV